MDWIRSEWFLSGTIKKFHTHRVGSFKILIKIYNNAQIIYLPKDLGISSTFNVKDLIEYKGPNFNPSNILLN